MHYDNGFEIIIAVFLYMIPQLKVLGPKAQDLVISLYLGEGESLPYFHLRSLAIRSELILTINQTGHIRNLTVKDTMELSKLKHLQCYMP